MDGHSGYNKIFITENDVHSIAFQYPGSIGILQMSSDAFWSQKCMRHLSAGDEYNFS